MSNTYIHKIAVFIFLAMMIITIAAEITNVFAELNEADEARIMNLINEKIGERDRQYTLFGWVLAFLGIVVTVMAAIFTIKFKQHLDLAKELGQIREDIRVLQRQYQDLASQLNRLDTFFIAYTIIFGVAIGILAYLVLR